MKDKSILVLVFITIIILLAGCSKNGDLPENIIGTYTYSECVYLNPLSSSTMEGYTGSENKNMIIYQLEENRFLIFDANNEVIEEFSNVEYINVDVYLDNEDIFNLFASDFLDNVDSRYDIYSDGKRIDYLIYSKDEEIFIAELKDLKGNTAGFSIWAIFNIE
jgi:hypothetical protein